ncbi:MAG: IPT/TIG domain-containing protein [Planctomycetes bacterium]|nr:IPT/TIG domain-containing protein [Planctomycetota bacterium]
MEPSEISALGGTTITVLGTGFRAGTGFAVLVGGSPALDATVLDSRKIVATAPPGAAGPADVTVVAGAGGGLHAYLYRIDPSLSWERIVEEVFRGLAAGKTAAAALREAQLRCLRGELVLEAAGGRPSRKLEHPFYWAPFVLTEG